MGTRDVKTIGIAWYKREHYAEIRGVMEDADVLPLDFETWLRRAETVVTIEHTAGSDIVKAMINPDVFAAWCRATEQKPNAAARIRHVNLAIEDYCSADRHYSTSARPVAANSIVLKGKRPASADLGPPLNRASPERPLP